jgi:pimeloyl-ACP methyl ester carboxylesterase
VKPTLILVPGLMCDVASWEPVFTSLQSVTDCRVVDHGLADTLPAMAEQVLAQAPERFALAGHSMGGRVALEVMRMAPERVTHLGLFDTGHLPKAAGAAGEAELAKRMALLEIARTQGVRAMGQEWVKGMVAPHRLADRVLIDSILDMIERKNFDIFQRQVHALIHRPDATDVLRRVNCPTLVMCGELDSWAPPAQHQALANELPARPPVRAIPECGHMAMQEQPEAVLRLMCDWLGLN